MPQILIRAFHKNVIIWQSVNQLMHVIQASGCKNGKNDELYYEMKTWVSWIITRWISMP